VRAPTRPDLTNGPAKEVDFLTVDISDKEQVHAAFVAPWPQLNLQPRPQTTTTTTTTTTSGLRTEDDQDAEEVQSREITVFHTAANIRFYERDPRLQHLSDRVNVDGTQNVLDAARAIGVTVFIYTSSGSVSIRRTRHWLWPWESEPKFFVQTINDDDSRLPRRHKEMFSNYAASKIKAEKLVRAADRTLTGKSQRGGRQQEFLRTGCLRPGNGIYGPGGDVLCGAYLARKVNPSWIGDILQNFTYVENASLAHFCYEQRLIDKAQGSPHPDLGGQAFSIVDAGPPLTYGDVYTVLTTLTDGRTVFPRLSATTMLMLSHMVEWLHLLQSFAALSSNLFIHLLGKLVPAPGGDLINLQPSLFSLITVHLIWDDSRARRSPENGGLGYEPQWTTLSALCKLAEEHDKSGGCFESRSMNGGVSLGFWGRTRQRKE
jgi:nucleoside-diphosphate-sugar epimerase